MVELQYNWNTLPLLNIIQSTNTPTEGEAVKEAFQKHSRNADTMCF